MPTMSIASQTRSAKDVGIFNQIAMFSVTGMAMSFALVFVCGIRVVNPWF